MATNFSQISRIADLVEPKRTFAKEPSQKKRKTRSAATEETFLDCVEEGDIVSHVMSSFQPLFLFSDWVQPGTTTRRLTVAILLPSGITTGKLFVQVQEDENHLQFTVRWPKPLLNLKHLHRKLLSFKSSDRIERYYSKMTGSKQFLKSFWNAYDGWYGHYCKHFATFSGPDPCI